MTVWQKAIRAFSLCLWFKSFQSDKLIRLKHLLHVQYMCAPSLTTFKSRLKTYMFSIAFGWIVPSLQLFFFLGLLFHPCMFLLALHKGHWIVYVYEMCNTNTLDFLIQFRLACLDRLSFSQFPAITIPGQHFGGKEHTYLNSPLEHEQITD